MIGLSRSLPDFVLIISTPLAPRVPYIADAVASFNTEKLSITSGSNEFRSALDTSTPSKIIKGEVAPFIVATPRIKKSAEF